MIPLRSYHNDSLCTASLHIRTFSGEDPTTGTAHVSVVSDAVNAHHINVKPTVRHAYKPPAVQCCMPCLCTHLVARSAATHVHASTSHWSLLPSDNTTCDLLQSEWSVAGGGGRRHIHISPYMGMSLILLGFKTETVIGIANNDANTGRKYMCSAN